MKIPLLLALVGTLGTAPWAQAPDDIIPPTTLGAQAPDDIIIPPLHQNERVFKLMLKNVKPSLMAYWLDPKNREDPPGLRAKGPLATDLTNAVPRTGVASSDSFKLELFQLPEGVDRIVAVDPQNTLLVFGTPQGAARLASTIAFLDKPMRQVEIEARFVRVAVGDMAKIFPQGLPPQKVQNMDENSGAAFDSLDKSGKIATITAPRALAFDHTPATVRNAVDSPVQLANVNGTSHVPGLPEGTQLYLETSRSLQVIPAVNDNDTITLDTTITQGLQLKDSPGATSGLDIGPNQSLHFVAAVRNGGTVAVALEQTPDSTKAGQTILVLLRAHVVQKTK